MPDKKRKNLLLGGGFIGSEVSSLLTERGEEVVTLSREEGHDLREAEKHIDYFDWADRVWFIAWDIPVWKYAANPEYQLKIIASNTRLCESIFGVLGKTRKPFLFTSSQLAGSFTPFGVTKYLGELWAKTLGGRVAKFWNVYGWEPVGDKSHVIPDMVHKAITEGKIELMTNGEEKRQFIYVRDCAEALLHQFEINQKYADITSGEWMPVKRVAEILAEKLQVGLKFSDKPGPESFSSPSIFLEGWKPRFTLEEGLALTIEKALKA